MFLEPRELLAESPNKVQDPGRGQLAEVRPADLRSEEHTSELQSHDNRVTGVQTCALPIDRKSTRLNSSPTIISYAVFFLKNKKTPPPGPPRCGCAARAHTARARLPRT